MTSNASIVASISQGARDHQEDAFGHWLLPKENQLFVVVADGAGGHGGGSFASTATIDCAGRTWQSLPADGVTDPTAFLEQWLRDAHLAVIETSAKNHCSARSVVVACFTDGKSAHWVHAGDCRLMRFHKGELVERTRDDSIVQVLFERGEITEEEMGSHLDQSRLLNSLGGEEAPRARLGSAQIEEGDTYILCSDGFWEHLRKKELEELSSSPAKKRQKALDEAVAEAVRRAGAKADNTSAVMICFDKKWFNGISCLFYLLLLLAALTGSIVALKGSGKLDFYQYWKKMRPAQTEKTLPPAPFHEKTVQPETTLSLQQKNQQQSSPQKEEPPLSQP
jgi:serine/threonine protein phosphatase PrpC